MVARARSEPPARCAGGMVPLGARCCGEGQRLVGKRCTGAPTRCSAGSQLTPKGCVPPRRVVQIAGGTLRSGPGDWEAQGIVEPRTVEVAPYAIDAYEVTEERWTECVAARACAAIALRDEPGLPVSNVTIAEADRFCGWAGGRLPTRDELAFAAAGAGGRRYAWGDTGAVCRRAVFGLKDGPCGFGAGGPELAGTHPDGASPEGIHDLAGNVAEWTMPASKAASTAEVRGGSYRDGAASALRSWSFRELPIDTRSPEVGFRCVYPSARPQPD